MIRRRFFFIGTLFAGLGIQAQQVVNLSDLDLSNISQEYGTVQVGKTAVGTPAVIKGTTYTDVIGTHAKSSLKIELKGDAVRFQSGIGVAESSADISDKSLITVPLVDGTKLYYHKDGDKKQFAGMAGKNGKISKGSVCFIVRGDGKELFRSEVMKGGSAPRNIDVDVKGIRLLELIADPTSDGSSGDNALWISSRITYQSVKPKTVSSGYTETGPAQTGEAARRLAEKISKLPVLSSPISTRTDFDWLITPERSKAGIYTTPDHQSIVVANPMVSRTFRIFPNLATTDYMNRMLGESLLRAVSSEGTLTIDGKEYQIGGLQGQPERGYIKGEWIEQLRTVPGSFLVEDFEVAPIKEDIKWARSRWALNKEAATGQEITFTLRGEKDLRPLVVKLHVAIYDKIPVIRKSFEVENESSLPYNIDAFRLEYLAFAEPESPVGGDPSKFLLPNIHVESDYACAGGFTEKETDITEKWVTDPAYTSQRNYEMQTPCILDVSPKMGPDQALQPGGTFRSFHVYEMPFDSYDRERKGLFTKRFYRTVAPWVTENPIFLHLTSTQPETVYRAIDQCAATGFEMIIFSFGSGLNAEDISDENIAKYKAYVDYARSKGIECGCYSLLSSRWISDEVDVINPETGKRGGMIFGSSPCLCSDWGYAYFDKIKTFIEKTGMRCFEHDGSYPGNVCASTSHAHHRGLKDSQWNQFWKIAELYHWMCESGISINVPDFYFLNGSTKVGIGYREANWSLPRDRQLIHTRQLNYDCTWERVPSSLWSFVPLVEYQGGGAAATLEPLSEHLFEYKTLMFQNFSAGVQACYRGPRLYDTEETRKAVTEVVAWYKKYREILNSDIIHLRKPDARDWDGIMHVRPEGKEKGLAVFYNPTDKEITRNIELPLYYTGLTTTARIREQEGAAVVYTLNRDYTADITVKIPANGYTWYVIE